MNFFAGNKNRKWQIAQQNVRDMCNGLHTYTDEKLISVGIGEQ